MNFDSIPHLSLGTAILIIFLICLGLVMLRGMGNILVGSFIAAASAWAAWTTWQLAPTLCHELLGISDGWLIIALPILAFVLSFWLFLKIIRFILTPFEMLQSEDRPKTSLITGFIIAVIPTFILAIIAASMIHHYGTLQEVRTFAQSRDSTPNTQKHGLLHSLKSSVDAIIPSSWMKKIDPMSSPDRVNAVKIVTHRSQRNLPPIIDPESGQPYPRAIIVDDPELQNLARQGKFGTLLRHPTLTKALNDPSVQKILHSINYKL